MKPGTMSHNVGKPSVLAMFATFLRGLIFMMPLQLCLVGSSFAMKRFGYDEEAVPIFVAFCSNAMEICELFGNISTLAISAMMNASAPSMFTYVASGISLISVTTTVVLCSSLLKTYAFTEDVDNITRYYWLLVLGNLGAGIDLTCITSIASDDLSPFELGYNSCGLVLVCFHWIVLRLLNICRLDIDYWLIVSQLILMVCLSTIAAVVWAGYLFQDKIMHSSGVASAGESEDSIPNGTSALSFAIGFGKCLPMILASAVSVSSMWAIYPLVAPYQVTPFEYHYPIQRLCLVADTASGFVNFYLGQYGGVRSDWYNGRNVWWHLLWLLFIPYLGIAYTCITSMHYPESIGANIIQFSPVLTGFLSVSYFFLGRFLFGLSLVPMHANANGYGEVISPVNMGASLFTVSILKYMSEAYVQEFKLAKEGLKAGKAWPTDGMSKNSAIRHWIRTSATVGYANFKELASADVKQRLGAVPRHIVSYRRAASIVE